MVATLDTATWFWLVVPMCAVLLLSIITFFTDR